MQENIANGLLQDVENLMQDILLSGFSGVQEATISHLAQYGKQCEKIGMQEGSRLILWLYQELQKRKNSFHGEKAEAAKVFCRLEFYLRNAKEQLT